MFIDLYYCSKKNAQTREQIPWKIVMRVELPKMFKLNKLFEPYLGMEFYNSSAQLAKLA